MRNEDEFYDMVNQDIKRLSESTHLSDEQRFQLHRELDGKYQACVRDWRAGFWASNETTIYYNELLNCPDEVKDNLDMMKSKLETFRFQVNAIEQPQAPAQHINVTTNTNFNLNITFDQARLQVKDMDSLTDAQTKDVLNRITEIEKIVQSTDSKKSKWEKVKPVLVWLADKSYDLAKTILPLILKIQE